MSPLSLRHHPWELLGTWVAFGLLEPDNGHNSKPSQAGNPKCFCCQGNILVFWADCLLASDSSMIAEHLWPWHCLSVWIALHEI